MRDPSCIRTTAIFKARMTAFVVASVALSSVGGCARQGGEVVVVGKVTYDGKAVTNGDIRFFPATGSAGRPAGAPIVDGVYEARYKGGVPIGVHRVEIRAFSLEGVGAASGSELGSADITAKAVTNQAKTNLPFPVYVVEGRAQFLPPKYNDQSELEVEVEVTGGELRQTCDFELTSKPS